MRITAHVDQARALREGIDAPHSTTRIEVDPGDLTPAERELLALLLRNGHDTTTTGLAQPDAPDDTPICAGAGTGRPIRQRLMVVEPSVASLRVGMAELLAWHSEETAELAKQRAKADAAIDAAIDAAATATEEVGVYLYRDKPIVGRPTELCHRVDLPKELPWLPVSIASPEAAARHKAAADAIKAERERLLEAAAVELRRQRDEAAAQDRARQAERQAEYDALYARLPEALRERDAARFASRYEIATAMRRLALADIGQSLDAWCLAEGQKSEPLTELTEAEFAALKAARQAAPAGTTVEPHRIWIAEYRPATEQELDDGLGDEDDEVEERRDERRVLLIEWKVGHLGITAVVPLNGRGAEPGKPRPSCGRCGSALPC